MQALSRALVGLYEAAEHCSIEEYPGEAVRSIRSLIEFDAAVLETSGARANGLPDFVVSKAYVYQDDSPVLEEYDQVPAEDSITRCFSDGLDKPRCCNAASFYREHPLRSLEAFSKKHLISCLMLFGEPQCEPNDTRWVVLHRRRNTQFNEIEAQYLTALWPHISRGFTRNRSSFLDRQLKTAEDRAAALVRTDGAIEVADSRFRRLLAVEWPEHTGNGLPDVVLHAWRTGHHYTGARIHISMYLQQGYVVCCATVNETLRILTKTERIVAQQFASGYSNKDIALQLSVSQNTVRSHIAHIYTKLGVHDKAELANCISRNADRPRGPHGSSLFSLG